MPFIFSFKIPRWLYFVAAALIVSAMLLSVLHLQNIDASSKSLFGQVIVIDPGHGGFDPGVLGCTDSVEKNINLQISLLLAEFLREGGASVVLLRDTDMALANTKAADLAERVRTAEAAQADIYLSLHCNAYQKDSPWHGAQCFYHSKNINAGLLANEIQKSLRSSLLNTDRTALTHDTTFILKNLNMPAVIIEMGFLSNRDEESLLKHSEYQFKMAWAIYIAICHYFADINKI